MSKSKNTANNTTQINPTALEEIKLTPEEITLIKAKRQEKIKQEAKEKLEREFAVTLQSHIDKIQILLIGADNAIREAMRISDNTGIPFTLYTPGMPANRQYTPSTLKSKLGVTSHQEFFELFGKTSLRYDEDADGFEFWNDSSLTC